MNVMFHSFDVFIFFMRSLEIERKARHGLTSHEIDTKSERGVRFFKVTVKSINRYFESSQLSVRKEREVWADHALLLNSQRVKKGASRSG